jgi:hypothetical protein
MADDKCVDKEGNFAASMQIWGIATVKIILIRPIDWRNAPFNFCEVLPRSRKFISKLSYSYQEEALHDIALDISALVREARNSRYSRETNRVVHRPILHQTQFMPVMTPIESLIKKKQTDDIKLERHTDEFKLERHTDEFKRTRQTEDLKQRKTNRKPKQNNPVFADEADTSTYTPAPIRKTLPRPKRRTSTQKKRVKDTSWLRGASKEYEFISKGHLGIFFISALLIDGVGIPAAILNWTNSWVLFWIAFLISIPLYIVGVINIYNIIPIPFALLFAGAWGVVIQHYFHWNPLYTIAACAAIAFTHFLLFRKNSR